MGSSGSTPLEFKAQKDCGRWAIPDVQSSVTAWQALVHQRVLKKHPDAQQPVPPPGGSRWAIVYADERYKAAAQDPLTRRDFFEVCGAHNAKGKFLTLLNHFDTFAGNTGSVAAEMILTWLSLTCHGLVREKVGLVFEMFCPPTAIGLSQNEMLTLVISIATAAHRVGIMTDMPNASQAGSVCAEMFVIADANMDGFASRDEFMDWGLVQLKSMHLVTTAFTARKRHTIPIKLANVGKRVSESSMTSTGSNTSGYSKSSGASAHSSGSGGSSALSTSATPVKPARHQHAATSIHSSLVALAGYTPHNRSSTEETSLMFGTRVRLLMKRTRAAKLRMICNERMLTVLEDNTHFSRAEILSIAGNFVHVSEANGTLQRSLFEAIVKEHFSGLAQIEDSVDTMYKRHDQDQDGLLSFQEFIGILSIILRGAPDERLGLLFELYDTDNDGTLQLAEFIEMVRAADEHLGGVATAAQQIMDVLRLDADSEISSVQFLEALAKQPYLIDTFSHCTKVTMSMVLAVRGLYQVQPNVNFDTLALIPKRLVGSSTRAAQEFSTIVNMDQFRTFMADNFTCTPDHFDKVDELFRAFDPSMKGLVNLRNVLCGMAQMLARSTEEQARFYFDFYDTNGNGRLDANEIMYMLVGTRETTDAAAAILITALNHIDSTGSGKVTQGEFKHRGLRSALVISCMEKAFAYRREIEIAPQNVLFKADGTSFTTSAPLLEDSEEDAEASEEEETPLPPDRSETPLLSEPATPDSTARPAPIGRRTPGSATPGSSAPTPLPMKPSRPTKKGEASAIVINTPSSKVTLPIFSPLKQQHQAAVQSGSTSARRPAPKSTATPGSLTDRPFAHDDKSKTRVPALRPQASLATASAHVSPRQDTHMFTAEEVTKFPVVALANQRTSTNAVGKSDARGSFPALRQARQEGGAVQRRPPGGQLGGGGGGVSFAAEPMGAATKRVNRFGSDVASPQAVLRAAKDDATRAPALVRR